MEEQQMDLKEIMESNRRKILMIHEGWSFISDVIGKVTYFRPVSPDGWMPVIDIRGRTMEWAIEKGWNKRNEAAVNQFELAEWLRKYGEAAGITWDKTQDSFCASVFTKGTALKEAFGASPSEAVANWKARWERNGNE